MPSDSLHAKHPAGQPILALDGSDLLGMAGAGHTWLRHHMHTVNTLNVYPVPDGDTGTNMVLTMQAACKAASEASAGASAGAGVIAQALAGGAVRGARGNSGVILSQILRGFAESSRNVTALDSPHFAAAMRQAKETAYKGVLKPVEGTILTVIRLAAEASGHAAAINPDLRFILEATLSKAQQALASTPDLLPVLKLAGVVDAGGQGLVYVLEGMVKYLRGEALVVSEQESVTTTPMFQPNLEAFGDEWGYDIQYLVYGDNLDEDAIRQRLLELGGDSVVVGRAGAVIKVHVHGDDPGPFVTFGASLGHLDDIVLENMTLQTLRRKGEWSEPVPAIDLSLADTTEPYGPECLGIVTVVAGDGLRKVFESLGVCAFVSGGQTMNPSTGELLQAAERLPHEDVIVLPNNRNIILAAKQAAALVAEQRAEGRATKRLHVVETRSMPQGIAAMLGYSSAATVEENLRAMTRSAQTVRTGEITTAVRQATFDGVDVQPGDIIGLIEGQLQCKGDNPDAVVMEVLAQMDPDGGAEIFTLFYGEPVTAAAASALCEEIEAAYPDHTIDLLPGGQPHYHYLISVE